MIDLASILAGSLRVLVVGLLLGAGLPLLFGVGLRLRAKGESVAVARWGSWAVFGAIALVVLYALMFITAKSLQHYLGITLPF
ncbi:hypothetical protein ACXET9_11440 [Brachybacterium sp. DNPG3]